MGSATGPITFEMPDHELMVDFIEIFAEVYYVEVLSSNRKALEQKSSL